MWTVLFNKAVKEKDLRLEPKFSGQNSIIYEFVVKFK